MLKVARAICRSVDEVHGGSAVVINADDLLLLFTYLIITLTNGTTAAAADADETGSDGSDGCMVACWHAQLSLMSDYLTDKQRCMLRGYYLATMQAALELVMTDDFNPIGPTLNSAVDSMSADSFSGSDNVSAADMSTMESPSNVSVSSMTSGSGSGSSTESGSGYGSGNGSGTESGVVAVADDDEFENMGELIVIVQ